MENTVAVEVVKTGFFAAAKEAVTAAAKENPVTAGICMGVGGAAIVGAIGYGVYRWLNSDSPKAEEVKDAVKEAKEAAKEKVAEATDEK